MPKFKRWHFNAGVILTLISTGAWCISYIVQLSDRVDKNQEKEQMAIGYAIQKGEISDQGIKETQKSQDEKINRESDRIDDIYKELRKHWKND